MRGRGAETNLAQHTLPSIYQVFRTCTRCGVVWTMTAGWSVLRAACTAWKIRCQKNASVSICMTSVRCVCAVVVVRCGGPSSEVLTAVPHGRTVAVAVVIGLTGGGFASPCFCCCCSYLRWFLETPTSSVVLTVECRVVVWTYVYRRALRRYW